MPSEPWTLFVDHDFPDVYRELLAGRAVAVGPGDEYLATAPAVLAGAKRAWNAEAFALAPQLKVLSRIGIGYDNVDVAAAAAAGVVVCNAPDAPTVSTAEQTIALMMAIGRELPAQIARARAGLPGAPVGTAFEFDGRVLGLVGLGRIARRVAAVGNAMGMRVIACDPYVSDVPDGIELVSLADVLSNAEVLSLHAPATPQTRHLLNATTLATTRPGVLIVNCARGALIDQDALLDALDAGQVGGAALDVTEPEPLPVGHRLLDHERVIVTPHVASATVAGRRRLYEHAIENALAVLEGRPATVVAPPL